MSQKFEFQKKLREVEVISVTQGGLLVMAIVAWKAREQIMQMIVPANAEDTLSLWQNLSFAILAFIIAAILGLTFWKKKIRNRLFELIR